MSFSPQPPTASPPLPSSESTPSSSSLPPYLAEIQVLEKKMHVLEDKIRRENREEKPDLDLLRMAREQLATLHVRYTRVISSAPLPSSSMPAPLCPSNSHSQHFARPFSTSLPISVTAESAFKVVVKRLKQQRTDQELSLTVNVPAITCAALFHSVAAAFNLEVGTFKLYYFIDFSNYDRVKIQEDADVEEYLASRVPPWTNLFLWVEQPATRSPEKYHLYINTTRSSTPSSTKPTPPSTPSNNPKKASSPNSPTSPSPKLPPPTRPTIATFVTEFKGDIQSYALPVESSLPMYRIWNDTSTAFWGMIEKDLRVTDSHLVKAPTVASGWNGISLYSDVGEMFKHYRGSPSSTPVYTCLASGILSLGGLQLLRDPNNEFHFGLSPSADMQLVQFAHKLQAAMQQFVLISTNSNSPLPQTQEEGNVGSV